MERALGAERRSDVRCSELCCRRGRAAGCDAVPRTCTP